MKHIGLILVMAMLAACGKDAPLMVESIQTANPPTSSNEFMNTMNSAMNGDYQAQRNLAYGFAAYPYPGQEKNKVLACAWYLVVLNSGHKQVDAGDQGNADIHCGGLEPALLETAKQRSSQFLSDIKSRHMPAV